MKKYIFMTLFGILFNSCSTTKENETRNLERFDKVNLIGRVELHLKRNPSNSMEIRTKNASDIPDLVTEVRNGELFIYHKNDCDKCEKPKYIIYLNHSGVSDLKVNGVIKLISDDVISQKDLIISGEGILKGNIKVSVDNLSTNINGISNIYISGQADVANLKIAGIGMINAKSLETNSTNKSTDGFATVLLPLN
ncbi:GIN domain-containing protein [Aquimarina addita]